MRETLTNNISSQRIESWLNGLTMALGSALAVMKILRSGRCRQAVSGWREMWLQLCVREPSSRLKPNTLICVDGHTDTKTY